MSFIHALGQDPSIKTEFYQALVEAELTFLSGVKKVMTYDESLPTGVGELNFLNINFNTPLVGVLRPAVKDWKEAWLLVLAHESGHLLLNSICDANGEDPGEQDAQFRAMGISPQDPSIFAAKDFQKETAIESFCDACLAKAAFDLLGTGARAPILALRTHRALARKSLGLFKADIYATHPALDAMLDSSGAMKPEDAARVALAHSLLHTSAIKKTAVAAAEEFFAAKKSWGKLLEQWRSDRSDNDEAPPKGPTAR